MVISFILPCYNEEKNIIPMNELIKSLPFEKTIYFYDNLSNDSTKEKIMSIGNYYYCDIQGKGATIKRMFSEVDSDYYVLIDCDMTYDISKVKDHIDLMAQNNIDVIHGMRIFDRNNIKTINKFGNYLFSGLFNLLLNENKPISDVLSGYKIFNKKFVKSVKLKEDGFTTEIDIALNMKKFNYQSVSVNYYKRLDDNSKLSTFKDGIRILLYIIKKGYLHSKVGIFHYNNK